MDKPIVGTTDTWFLQHRRTGQTAKVIYYRLRESYEVKTKSEILFKRLTRHLGVPRGKTLQQMWDKLNGRAAWGHLNMRVVAYAKVDD